jgi:phospholipid transport system substrate-binding protein
MRQGGSPALMAGAVFILFTIVSNPVSAQAVAIATVGGDVHPAALHMEKLGGEVVAALSDASLTGDQRIAHFREVLTRDLDIPLIARFVAGRHWRTASPEDRRAYVDAFGAYLVKTFSARLGGTAVDRFEVVGARGIGKADILVHSRVAPDGAKALRADWRVREKNGSFRILDLSVEGISLALTLRKEFASVLRREGGIGGLVPILKDRAT